MALIRQMDRSAKERNHVYEEVSRCTYDDFTDLATGERYLQLDTYGRPSRDFPAKTSQAMQFDRAGALRLKQIIEQVFGI
jgi:hypothetical protein